MVPETYIFMCFFNFLWFWGLFGPRAGPPDRETTSQKEPTKYRNLWKTNFWASKRNDTLGKLSFLATGALKTSGKLRFLAIGALKTLEKHRFFAIGAPCGGAGGSKGIISKSANLKDPQGF